MDLQLEGNIALVSGSTARIGKAIALGLAREGASVIINGRTSERVNKTIDSLKVVKEYPQVDILVNNLV